MFSFDEIKSLPELMNRLIREGVPSEYYKIYTDRFLDFKARKQGVPLSGQFELTPLCNLDCKMCYVHLTPNQLEGKRLLSVDEWKSLMSQAIDCGMMFADLTGGECLTYPGFDELYLFLLSKGVEVSVKTNGILLDKDRIEFFKKNRPSGISISIYGSSEESYERVTGKRAHELILNNIKMAKAAELPIKISITPSRFMNDIEEIVKWAHGEGFKSIVNVQLINPREETGRANQELDVSLDEYVEIFKCVYEIKGRELFNNENREVEDNPTSGYESNIGLRCAAGRSSFDIDWTGKMYACSSISRIFEMPLQDGFEKAWEKINEAAKQYVLPIECETCKDYKHCLNCAALHMNEPYGYVNRAVCERTRRFIEEGLR